MSNWQWVLGQIEGYEYWKDTPYGSSRPRFRRKIFPIMTYHDGGYAYWHVWRMQVEPQYTTSGRMLDQLIQGWGGSIGAAHEPEDFVQVGNYRKYDGTMYTPTIEDLEADDWERIDA